MMPAVTQLQMATLCPSPTFWPRKSLKWVPEFGAHPA
jgi:hypothetical protein